MRGFVSGVQACLTPKQISLFLLSVVPGLAHAVQGRIRFVLFLPLLWLALLAASLFWYGDTAGYLFRGALPVLHAWIALDAMPAWRQVRGVASRTGAILAAVCLLWILHLGAASVLSRELVAAPAALDVPSQGVLANDLLLGHRQSFGQDSLIRGRLVLIRYVGVGHGYYWNANAGAAVRGFGQVIALPGETVTVAGGSFVVDGKPLDSTRYPVPQWLKGRNFRILVRHGHCFVSGEYSVAIYNMPPETVDRMILPVCVVAISDIGGRAFMRWLPFSRRGFLPENE
jgi:hypothetical protein